MMHMRTHPSIANRHADPRARLASGAALTAVAALLSLPLFLGPTLAQPEAGPAAAAPPSACLPHDAALGNAGGDPYMFYAFDREAELQARQASPSCNPRAAAAAPAASPRIFNARRACAAYDVHFITLIDDHAESAEVEVASLIEAVGMVTEARRLCGEGQFTAALALYERIPLQRPAPAAERPVLVR